MVLLASSGTGLAIGVLGITGTYASGGAIEAAGLLRLLAPGLLERSWCGAGCWTASPLCSPRRCE
jgi:hypothetical protein